MATNVIVKSGIGSATESIPVEGDPATLSHELNETLKAGEKFITFTGGDGKKISLIAERVEVIRED